MRPTLDAVRASSNQIANEESANREAERGNQLDIRTNPENKR